MLPALLLAAALAGAGCGGDGDDNGGGGGGATTPPAQTSDQGGGDDTGGATAPARTTEPAVDGEAVFASAGCASCHTLAAANARGVTGPNLDDLQPSFEQVREQVINGGGGMPAYEGDLSDAEIDAVARYVSENAG